MSANIKCIQQHKKRAKPHDPLDIAYDVVFILNANSKGWILDKICKIVEQYSDLNCYFLYTERNDQLTSPLPKARAYFFAHFAIAFWTMVKFPHVHGGSIFTYFTHFDQGKGVSSAELIEFMNLCDHVFVMNSADRRALVSLGVNKETMTAVIGGADPDVFKGHKRGNGIVGFVGAYYPRKQPEKMIALIRSMPDVSFILLAPGPNDVANAGMLWKNWPEFHALTSLPNLKYVEAPYEDYPEYFKQMDVYVSLSSQEGGPIPVIEAMMANAVALATNTGFAEDVLTGDLAQYVLDVDAPVETIAQKVRTALKDKKTDVRRIAQHISWESVGNEILDIMAPTLALDRDIPVLSTTETLSFEIDGSGRPLLGKGWTYFDGYAQPPENSGDLIFKLSNEEARYVRMTLGFGLPNHGSETAATASLWDVDVKLNGRALVSRRMEAAEYAQLDCWVTLSDDDVENDVVVSLIFKPVGLRASKKVSELVVLRDMEWIGMEPPVFSTVHDLSIDGEGGIYLSEGWHAAELAGRWTSQPTATVGVFVPAEEKDRMLTPIVTCRSIACGLDGALNIRIETKDTTAEYDRVVEVDDFVAYELDPLLIEAGSSGPIMISLGRTQTFKPNELSNENKDKRDLGLLVRDIELRG